VELFVVGDLQRKLFAEASGQKTRTTIKVRIQLTLKCSDVSNLGRTLRVNCGIESEFTAEFRIGAYRDGQFALHVASGRYAASR
jgi:hypothetical protein